MDPLEEFRRAAEAETGVAPPLSDGGNPLASASDYQPPQAPRAPTKPYQFNILPLSKDESGEVSFDSHAGLLGAFLQPFRHTNKVMTGQIPADVRNPEYLEGALESAMTFGAGPTALTSRAGRGAVARPTVGAMDEAAEAGFRNYRDSLQMYGGDEYRTLLQSAQDRLRREGLLDVPGGAPVPHRILQDEAHRVRNAPFVTSRDLDALRVQMTGKGLRDQNVPANMQARDELFGFIDRNLPPGDRSNSVRDAVGNYRQARHSEVLTDKDLATERLNLANVKGPLDAGQTRTNIAQLLNSRGKLRGFSENERNVLEGVVQGTPAIDRAQKWGARGALNTNSLGMMGLTAIPAMGAAGLRSYANRGARRMADEADAFIRAQSPLGREQFATAPNNYRAGVPKLDIATGTALAAAMEARRQEQEREGLRRVYIRKDDEERM